MQRAVSSIFGPLPIANLKAARMVDVAQAGALKFGLVPSNSILVAPEETMVILPESQRELLPSVEVSGLERPVLPEKLHELPQHTSSLNFCIGNYRGP